MSNIGNKSIVIPNAIKVLVKKNIVFIDGPLGESSQYIHHVNIIIKNNEMSIKLLCKKRKYKKFHGLYRSLINNMIIGVTNGFQKTLVLHGLGYKASIKDKTLAFSIGFSHIVYRKIPLDLNVSVSNQNKQINVSGINKEKVGSFTSQLRSIRTPEPYLGKGIRYIDEIINKKQGKKTTK